jgi:hypothetical protein
MRFEQLETMRDAGFYVSDIGQALQYRPELFGGPFSELMQTMMRDGESDWSVGERELFAAFASSLRQCPF